MTEYTKYLQSNRSETSPRIEFLLKQGIFYVSGRDAYYRPILVFDVKKMLKLDLKIEEVLEAQTIFFDTVLNKLLLPGQV